VSSRLAVDGYDRRIAVVTTPSLGLEVGLGFLVLGDSLPVGEPGFTFTGQRTGRSALAVVRRARVQVRCRRADSRERLRS